MDIKSKLSESGFLFIPEWNVDISTKALAESIGRVVNISGYFNHSMISDVQYIYPKDKIYAHRNHYSGKFGLKCFPFHTDLAHWSSPPKYFMLRCVKGFEEVSTKILPLKSVLDIMLKKGLRRAVAKSRGKQSCMLPLFFKFEGEDCVRWDSLFLEPMNECAKSIRDLMACDELWDMAVDIRLVNYGDTLIFDNYLNFHARSSVPPECVERVVERVYFN